MSDEAHIVAYTWAPLYEVPVADAMLAAVESVASLRPTHWGKDEFARLPYDRAAILDTVKTGSFASTLTIARKKTIRQLAAFQADRTQHPSLLRVFTLQTKGGCSPKQLPDAFTLGDRLAATLTPELGFVHRFSWDVGEHTELYNHPLGMSSGEMQEFGLEGLYARTWFGPELTRRLGRARLEETGSVVRDTPWGGVVLDLVPEPWSADPETLFRRQQEATAVLRASGMFGVYEGLRGVHTKRAPAWSPLASPVTAGA